MSADCTICLEPLVDHTTRELQCAHTFHEACIHTWLAIKPECPNCRTGVVVPETQCETEIVAPQVRPVQPQSAIRAILHLLAPLLVIKFAFDRHFVVIIWIVISLGSVREVLHVPFFVLTLFAGLATLTWVMMSVMYADQSYDEIDPILLTVYWGLFYTRGIVMYGAVCRHEV